MSVHIAAARSFTFTRAGLKACGLVLLLGVFGAVAAAAESTAPWVSRHYRSTDGLPVSSAADARVDADGFLWIATHDGLARFDGQTFSVYDSSRFPQLPGNRMLAFMATRDARLYALGVRGELLDVRSDGLTVIAPDAAHPDLPVLSMDEPSGCLTLASGLFCADGHGGFDARLRFDASLDPVMAVPTSTGDVWIVARDGRILRHDGKALHIVTTAVDLIDGVELPQHVVADDGSLWIGRSNGLLHIGREGVRPWRPAAGVAALGAIGQLRLDAEGSLWIGAENGLFTLRDGQLAVDVLTTASDGFHRSWRAPDKALWRATGGHLSRDGVSVLRSSGSLIGLRFDDDGNVCALTLRDGIYVLSRPRVDLLDAGDGLHADNLYGVAREAGGTVWLGSLGGGLQAVPRSGPIRRYGRADGLPGENPWAVAVAPDGAVYVGTWQPGLYRKTAGGARFESVDLPVALAQAQVLAMVFDANGQLWIGTSHGAWRQVGAEWQQVWPSTPGPERVAAILHGRDGSVWFGGERGLWRQTGAAHAAHAAHAMATARLAGARVRDLFQSSDGAVWASTDGRGLLRIAADDVDGSRAHLLGRSEGLPSSSPHAVREDANGSLWVNSNQGIFRISRNGLADYLAGQVSTLSPLSLGLADGLNELEGNGSVQPSATVDVDGRLWFPSQRGIVRFDPLALPLRTQAPRPVIDGIDSDGDSLRLQDALPRGVRSLLVRYGAADLHAGSEVRFRYRLLPGDRDWTDAGTRRAAAFAALAPGDYRFEVLAGNSDGFWSKQPTVFAFRVPPWWHETFAFRAAVAALLLLLVAWLTQLRVRALRQRAVQLDAEVQQRTAELRDEKSKMEAALDELSRTHADIEQRNRRLAEQASRLETLDSLRTRLLADVSHELRTPLMLVTLPLQELHLATTSSLLPADRRRLTLALQQADRLGVLVEQLVGLVQAEAGQLRLRISRFDLIGFVRDVVAAYQPAATRVGVVLVAELPTAPQPVFADRTQLTAVLGNLIDNATKFAPPGSRIEVSLSVDEVHERVRLQVRDHGPGFAPELALRLFERFFRAEGPPRGGREGLGIGLALARELTDLHGGRIWATSAPGQGASFHVELPLGSAHIALDDLELASTAPELSALAPSADGSGEVLLVEDHADLAAYLSERLGEHLPVTCVGSAEAALEHLGRGGVRVLVSDVMLPGCSGIELCRQVRGDRRFDAVPVLLISAKAAAADREAGIAAGAVDYLAKPFGIDALLAAIARVWPASVARAQTSVSADEIIDPLLQLALDGLAESDFDIGVWAERACLSPRQLRRRVTELTPLSPVAWLREQRLRAVRELVGSGQCRTLVEAGARVGLDNPTYLYRIYRARFGDS